MMKVTNDFYKQFEKICTKLDKVLEENQKLKLSQKMKWLKKYQEEIKWKICKWQNKINVE